MATACNRPGEPDLHVSCASRRVGQHMRSQLRRRSRYEETTLGTIYANSSFELTHDTLTEERGRAVAAADGSLVTADGTVLTEWHAEEQ